MADFRSKPTLIPREYKDGSGWYIGTPMVRAYHGGLVDPDEN
jgi:hypothetical protein